MTSPVYAHKCAFACAVSTRRVGGRADQTSTQQMFNDTKIIRTHIILLQPALHSIFIHPEWLFCALPEWHRKMYVCRCRTLFVSFVVVAAINKKTTTEHQSDFIQSILSRLLSIQCVILRRLSPVVCILKEFLFCCRSAYNATERNANGVTFDEIIFRNVNGIMAMNILLIFSPFEYQSNLSVCGLINWWNWR